MDRALTVAEQGFLERVLAAPVSVPKLPGFFLFASTFWEQYLRIRKVWMAGYLGAGKTLLSVAMAHHMLWEGWVDGVVANFPTCYPYWVGEGRDDLTLDNRFCIVDEAHQEYDARTSLVNRGDFGAYARKVGAMWAFPSVYKIDKRGRDLIAWRTAGVFGDSFWLYRWRLGEADEITREEEGGWFLLRNPSFFFPMYAHKWIPTDDGGLGARWHNSLLRATKGKGAGYSERAESFLEAISKASEGNTQIMEILYSEA